MNRIFIMVLALMMVSLPAWAQQKSTTEAIEDYRAQIADGNPADLFVDEGAEIWKTKAGPKNASLEACDLGKGPGVVKGAFAELPRYFKDTDKVMDMESRLLWCMETLQGIDSKAIVPLAFNSPEKKKLINLSAYISSESKGMTFKLPQSHDKEKEAYSLGKKLFYVRGGPHDFACATCHSADGARIRLQDLPNLTKQEGAAKGFGSWPAYRVSGGEMWSMQYRLNDCYRQQRFPEPIYGSDTTVALGVYLGVTATGGTVNTPGLKR